VERELKLTNNDTGTERVYIVDIGPMPFMVGYGIGFVMGGVLVWVVMVVAT